MELGKNVGDVSAQHETPIPPACDLRSWMAGCLLAVVFSSLSAARTPKELSPTLNSETYITLHGGTLIPAGRLEIDGRSMTCGQYPTVLDPDLDDFGEAATGFVVLNPRLFSGLATAVKLWIFSHECAHQTVGKDEVKADCIAIKRGRREGWLSESGLEQVCEFMKPAHGDQSHFTGTQRCALMQQCFNATKKSERR